MAHFITRFRPLAYRLLLSKLAFWVGLCLVGAGVTFALIEAFDKLFILRETTAFFLHATVLAAAGTTVLAGFARLVKRKATLADLANQVEEEHPELMDSLNAAVEVTRIPQSKRSLIESLLMEEVSKSTEGIDFEKVVIPRYLGFYGTALLWLGALALLTWAHFFDASYKFRYALGDWMRGEFTGFYLMPETLEVARNEDFTVGVIPRRWDTQLTIEFLENGDLVRYPMNPVGDNRADFQFYDVEDDFQFRVKSHALTSPWYGVLVYDPPEIDRFDLQILPPGYSGYQPEARSQLEDLEILQGTRLAFEIYGQNLAELTVEFDDEPLALQRDDAGEFAFEMRPEESSALRFVMHNFTGHRAQTPAVQLKVWPDEKPVVEWVDPGKDITVSPEDVIPLELFVADDFGLEAVILNLSISGTRQESIALHRGDGQRRPGAIEMNLYESLDLYGLGVMDGDVISYSATAMDNKEPEPNIVRSEVFFVEVRVNKEPIELEGMDLEGETERVDVRALVIELKRIIRDTYAAMGLSLEDKVFANQEIGVGLASLRSVVETVMVRAAPLLTQQNQDHLMEFLIRARDALETAETMINNNATALAIAPEEQALAELVSFEAELSRNQTNNSGNPDDSEEESEDRNPPPPSAEQQNQPQGGQSNFAELPELLDEINGLVDRQSDLNEAIDRADRRQATPGDLDALAEEQTRLAADAIEMRDKMESMLPGDPSARAVDRASEEMGLGAGQLKDEQPGLARGSGERAKELLMGAATFLEQTINQVAAQMMENLANRGRQLAARQQQAAGQSGRAAQQELNEAEEDALKEGQQDINRDYEAWQETLDQVANQLREQFPEASSELESLSERAEDENIEGQMSRAENALHYERFARAEPIQEDLAEALEGLAQEIEGLAGEMPQLADAALRKALEDIQRAREDLQAMRDEAGNPENRGNLRALRGEISGLLSDLASRMEDRALEELSGELYDLDGDPSWSGTVRATDGILGKAGQVLLEHLRSSIRELQLEMLRQSSDPPEQYRAQVEKYFERLAEEGGGNS